MLFLTRIVLFIACHRRQNLAVTTMITMVIAIISITSSDAMPAS